MPGPILREQWTSNGAIWLVDFSYWPSELPYPCTKHCENFYVKTNRSWLLFFVLRVWSTCLLLTTGWKSRYTFWPWSRSSGRDLRIFLKWEFAFFLCGLYFCSILASKTIDQFMNCPIRIWNHKRTLPTKAARETSRGTAWQNTNLLGLLDNLRPHYEIRRIENMLHLAST